MPKTSTKVAMRPAPDSIANESSPGQADEHVSTSRADVPQQESRMTRIARRAHEIYEARGGNEGKALEDWLQAEREIDEAT